MHSLSDALNLLFLLLAASGISHLPVTPMEKALYARASDGFADTMLGQSHSEVPSLL
jgi:hypothetical protein